MSETPDFGRKPNFPLGKKELVYTLGTMAAVGAGGLAVWLLKKRFASNESPQPNDDLSTEDTNEDL